MRKFILLAAVLSMFVFAGCGEDGEGNGDIPHIVRFITASSDSNARNNNEKKTFNLGDNMYYRLEVKDEGKDINKMYVTTLKDGSIISENVENNLPNQSTTPFYYHGQFLGINEVGAWTIQIYLTDKKNNQSNTYSYSITVN